MMSYDWLKGAVLGAVALVFWTNSAHPQSIGYSVTSLGTNQWRYDYLIDDASPGPSFDEVTIYFDVTSDTSLALSTFPAGWDPLVIQPDPAIPADGYLDVIHLGGAVPAGSSIGGFSVTFTSLAASPGSQRFELYDSAGFTLLGSGLTVAAGTASPVSEPETIALLLAGLGAFGLRRQSLRRFM